jgi:preprotein translocase subunit SecD
MKTIVYSLLALFIFGIISAGFVNRAKKDISILVQSTDMNVSTVGLSQSAKIITNRLKDFSPGKFNLIQIPEKNQIRITLEDSWDLKVAEQLCIQKGRIGFYETYNRTGLSELIKGDNRLFSLFGDSNGNKAEAIIGCTSDSGLEKVNDYLTSSGLRNKCKFAWTLMSGNSELCLYALKATGQDDGLSGTDIENAMMIVEKNGDYIGLEFNFKKSAVQKWAALTKRNMNHAIAIVLDDRVLYAPVVKSEINSGKCEITGNFTKEQVTIFSVLVNNGEIPLQFKIIN